MKQKPSELTNFEMIFLTLSALAFAGIYLLKLYRRFFPSMQPLDKGELFYVYCAEDGMQYSVYRKGEDLFIQLHLDHQKLWAKKYPNSKLRLSFMSVNECAFLMECGAKIYKGMQVVNESFPNKKLRQYPINA